MKANIKSNSKYLSLYDMQKNCCCKVTAIPDHPLLDSLGISTEAIVKVQNKYAFGGPILLQVDTATIALGKDIATQITVKEVAS